MRHLLAIALMALGTAALADGDASKFAISIAVERAEATYKTLAADLERKGHVNRYQEQVYNPESLIAESDRDPLDIILRRTKALLTDIREMPGAQELESEQEALSRLEEQARSLQTKQEAERRKIFDRVHALRRKIAFENPLLNFTELLFIKRHRSRYNHMCDQFYGNFAAPGGGIFILSNPFGGDPKEKNILADSIVERGRLQGEKLASGSFLSPELSYDGDTIYFAYVECTGRKGHVTHLDHDEDGHWHRGRCYHLFRVRKDGSHLEQLTDGTWNDFDPCPLPNGRVAFITERRGGYLRCGRQCPNYTVFDMRPDGSDIRILSPHETNEWQPSVTHDGMIIYTRWDYVDRHGCVAHMPWLMTPDGRDTRAIHANFTPRSQRPDMEMDLRAVPESPRFAATAAPHHGQAYGSLVVVDPRVEDKGMQPVKRITPDVGFAESQRGAEVYGTPWPLSEKYYLCVYDPKMKRGAPEAGSHKKGNYGIYLVDVFGNKIQIYRDTETACLSPMPLRPRKSPPVIPAASQRLAEDPPEHGTMILLDVYDSLKPFPPNTEIKKLRIYRILPLSVSSRELTHNTGIQIPQGYDSVNLARAVIGTVPVEKDGSAHFTVPAGKELFFQALDENGLAVQSMRSGTWVQPGERLSCQGCHEPKNRAPRPTREIAMAIKRPPSVPEPDVDGTDPFSYPRLVQPVLDKNCVDCHSRKEQAPRLDSKPMLYKTKGFMNKPTRYYASYISLAPEFGFYSYGEKDWNSPDFYRSTPGEFGALNSRLYKMLEEGHHDVELSEEEMHRITVWLDSCSLFYGVYEEDGAAKQLRGEIAKPTLE